MTQKGILKFPKIPSLLKFHHCEALKKKEGAISFKIPSKIPSLREVSETNDEAISFKIPSKISSLRGNKATEAISKNSIIHYRDPRVKPEDDIVRNSRIP